RSLSVAPLDDTKMGPAHLGMLGVLTLAIAIDSQKPFTFEFILPGVAAEYNLSSPGHQVVAALPVALIALVGIAGTVVGSLVWGCVADRWGRRSAILIAAMIFLATCACGAMPAFVDNLVMCFVMGLGAGGLLPIAYTLLAETIPARHRGQVVVLVAGVGTAAGFLLASATASWLMPGFGWRIMWFLGLPSGLCLVGLSGFIPESPRWLISQARSTDAEAILTRFGAQLVEVGTQPVGGGSLPARPSVAGLGPLTAALGIYGVGWGVVNFGFLTWLPTTAGHVGLSVAHISAILTNAALFSLPGALIVSWAYGRVSSKAVLVVVAALNVASLVAFAAFGTTVVTHPWVLTPALVACLVSLWGVISVLAPYAAEVYPTHIRAGGAGIAAGASKFGGVAALAMVVAGVSPPGISGSAILSAAVMGAGALAIARYGIETHHRSLEDIGPPKATAALAGLTP
ncbi:MAG: MFS transporter, partial [Acidimicrobiales bacterium]